MTGRSDALAGAETTDCTSIWATVTGRRPSAYAVQKVAVQLQRVECTIPALLAVSSRPGTIIKMLAQSIVNVIEGAVANRESAHLSGHVKSFDSLFTPENLAALERLHVGPFALFAFHPVIDAVITDYLRSGSLTGDSGSQVLALFVLDVPAHTPVDLISTVGDHWATVATASLSAVDVVRDLFKHAAAPSLPALIFLERLSGRAEPIAVSLSGALTAAEVRTRCLRACDAAARAHAERANGCSFAAEFVNRLTREGLDHLRGESVSSFEWFVRTVKQAHEKNGTLAAVVNLF